MRHQSASYIISNAKQSQKIVSTFENFHQIFGSLHILGLQKLTLKSTKVHGKSFFIKSNHINIYLMWTSVSMYMDKNHYKIVPHFSKRSSTFVAVPYTFLCPSTRLDECSDWGNLKCRKFMTKLNLQKLFVFRVLKKFKWDKVFFFISFWKKKQKQFSKP